jgi:uncharacterized protein YjiS (DUF1127 family)
MVDRIETILLTHQHRFSVGLDLRARIVWLAKLIARLAFRVNTAIVNSRQRAAERHLLATLDDRTLKDLGLSRTDVEREIHKRFWQE